MYYSIEDAAKVLAEALGKDDLSVSDLVTFALYAFSEESTAFHPRPWNKASVQEALGESLSRYPDSLDRRRQSIMDVMERVPDDATCSSIGWFFSGFALSEMINGGALANNEPEVQANLLSAMSIEKLSATALEMLHDDMHRFQLIDAVPMNLMSAMIACRAARSKMEEVSQEIDEAEERAEIEMREAEQRRATRRRPNRTRH